VCTPKSTLCTSACIDPLRTWRDDRFTGCVAKHCFQFSYGSIFLYIPCLSFLFMHVYSIVLLLFSLSCRLLSLTVSFCIFSSPIDMANVPSHGRKFREQPATAVKPNYFHLFPVLLLSCYRDTLLAFSVSQSLFVPSSSVNREILGFFKISVPVMGSNPHENLLLT